MRLKPATGLWKIQPQWVVTPGKQTIIQQLITIMEGFKTLFFSSKFPWARERIYSKFVDILVTSPEKVPPALL
jgi:hypothetical protein